MTGHSDSHDLDRFVTAQSGVYDQALAELSAGRKRTHWMWFVFPQFAGLGHSTMSQRYAIESIAEAKAYLAHPVLGARLRQCVEAMLSVKAKSAHDILGYPDDLKFRSSMTLFSSVAGHGSPFAQAIDRFFEGEPDRKTLELVGNAKG
ncbi:DUF1810 domain-containing protein [Rhizobium sp. BK376]|uniref:DUF1810 domain-containing protein n=1 Tax=Rhizobium sp. BK376 TaxID=2512149 RepID=UPI00104BEECF|nr:DUF1810 domain-containing protein [Rhizobium sp. BK376]